MEGDRIFARNKNQQKKKVEEHNARVGRVKDWEENHRLFEGDDTEDWVAQLKKRTTEKNAFYSEVFPPEKHAGLMGVQEDLANRAELREGGKEDLANRAELREEDISCPHTTQSRYLGRQLCLMFIFSHVTGGSC